MENDLRKWLHCQVELIYIDRKQRITQRRVIVNAVSPDAVKAYCLSSRSPHIFKPDHILAVKPVGEYRTGS